MKVIESCRDSLRRLPAVVMACMFVFVPAAPAQSAKPVKLQCESLSTPLGVDSARPLLSWKIQDARWGARQTAYQLQVASAEKILLGGKPDIWDSGQVKSDNSIAVRYDGPALEPSKRYYWRVFTWDQDGKQSMSADPTWWETGLLEQKNWKAQWIGYEEPEERAVRESRAEWITNEKVAEPKTGDKASHDFRFHFELTKPVRRAALYVTGQDSPGAWINGTQIVKSQPPPAWQQFPWKTYSVHQVPLKTLHNGQNTLAIEVVRYGGPPVPSQTPMNALLYVEAADGSTEVFKSSAQNWRATLNASGNWQAAEFDDSRWNAAVRCVASSPEQEPSELGNPWPTGAVKSLRRAFEITKPIASARIYATAFGAYKLSLNGKNVGDQILAPGWTDFRERVIYQAYDVTSDLHSGKNAVAALLAPGWYSTPLLWFQQANNYGDTPPALRAQLRIAYTDGSVDWILTDDKWKADSSPTLRAEIYDGETYDARKAQSKWDAANFDDNHWRPVEIVQPKETPIVWQYFPPIRAEQTIIAKKVTSPSPGVYIFDFAQNLSGVARIRVQGAAGTDVKMRFAEVLNPDGSVYTENLRTAKATDHFILAGNGAEEFQPNFTFHGFRYMEISGLKTEPPLRDVKAIAFHTDAPFTATLNTSSAMLNQLWKNILWGQRSNFVGVPTDCPQRDERLGWTADAQVFWRAAAYNMDLTNFSRKFGADMRGTQVGTDMYGIYAPGTSIPNPGYGTGWSDAGVVIPWTSWIQTGDKQIVEENWAGMEKYLAAIQAANPNYLWKKDYGIAFGDWLAPEGVTPEDLIATAYWAYDVTLIKQMAHSIGKTDDEKKYAELFEKIKTAFDQAYVKPDGSVGAVPPPAVIASGTDASQPDKFIETQTGYVLALHMNLLPDSMRDLAAKKLVDRLEANHWRLGTGFLGTPYLLGVLTDTGHADVAYRLLLSTEYPSWGYLVEHGATTMWERWNGDKMRGDPTMNSYNHYAYGAVADWIYRYAAGIDTVADDPGFHTIHLHPNFDKRLGNLDFSYESSYGTIHSSWTISGNNAIWKLTIPANATGNLPIAPEQEQSFKLDGQLLSRSSKVHSLANRGGAREYQIPAGTYQFEVTLP